MIILRQKEYGSIGRTWAGIKGAAKKMPKGALIGGIAVPFNGLAYLAKKKKLAAGITAVGATIGAGIGAKMGYDEGVSKYEYDHNPEYRAKIDKETKERIEKSIKTLKNEDNFYVSDFDYKSWLSLSKELQVPQEFLNYVKFYDSVWSRKVDLWYSDMMKDKFDDYYDIPEFKSFFPVPIDPELTKEWTEYDEGDLCLATVNSAGDDGWLYYNKDHANSYGWDSPGDSKSLKEILLKNIKHEEEDAFLSKTQIRLVNEFKNKINSL